MASCNSAIDPAFFSVGIVPPPDRAPAPASGQQKTLRGSRAGHTHHGLPFTAESVALWPLQVRIKPQRAPAVSGLFSSTIASTLPAVVLERNPRPAPIPACSG